MTSAPPSHHRLLAFWILSGSLLGAGCVNPVRDGYPPLVEACKTAADCPRPYACNDGGCEIVACVTTAECTFEPGLICFGAQCRPGDGG